MATTGFILAAMDAGIIPESTPSITDRKCQCDDIG